MQPGVDALPITFEIHSVQLEIRLRVAHSRLEEKVGLILQAVDKGGKKEIAPLDRLYFRD